MGSRRGSANYGARLGVPRKSALLRSHVDPYASKLVVGDEGLRFTLAHLCICPARFRGEKTWTLGGHLMVTLANFAQFPRLRRTDPVQGHRMTAPRHFRT